MKKFTTINDLKREAINLSKPILVRWPQHEKEEVLKPCVTSKLEHKYAINNSVMAFVCDGVMYVIPYMLPVLHILEQNGFQLGDMDVPFSKGDYPLFERAHWFVLEHNAYKQSLVDFENSCVDYCNEHNIMPIPDYLLKKCLEVPRDGIHVTHSLFEDIYYPVLTKPFFDTFAMHMLGLYSIDNNTCIFIYQNGNTYVTRCKEVMDVLPKYGYTKTAMFVPLSKGEKIVEPEYAELWKLCCE